MSRDSVLKEAGIPFSVKYTLIRAIDKLQGRVSAGNKKIIDLSNQIANQKKSFEPSGAIEDLTKQLHKAKTVRDNNLHALNTAIKLKGEGGWASFFASLPSLTSVLTGATIAILLGYAAYRVYKHFFSAAAKACTGKKGKERAICMINYQVQSLNNSISTMERALPSCSQTEDPIMCKAYINKRIKSYTKKMNKAKERLRTLERS